MKNSFTVHLLFIGLSAITDIRSNKSLKLQLIESEIKLELTEYYKVISCLKVYLKIEHLVTFMSFKYLLISNLALKIC